MKRRTAIGVLGGALLSLVGSPLITAYASESNQSRAIASYAALQKYFYVNDGSYLYHEQYPVAATDNAYSYEWPFSQAHGATLDLSNLPGEAGRAYRDAVNERWLGQERYWNTTGATGLPGYDSYARTPYGNGGDKFYDDNEWVGLASIQRYKMWGEDAVLERAKRIFALVVSGWDNDATHPAPGGVFWTQAPWSHDRNTVSNMPGAELGLRLYQVTGEQHYFDWAKKMYDWTNTYLLAPNGLYWDHVDLQGNIEKTQWSYNQGVPVGVNVLFYQATGDATYLQRAEQIAQAALAFYGTTNLDKQPAFFNSIFFKNLLLLQSVNHNQDYVKAMQAYADRAWENNRDATTGLFHFNGSQSTQMIEQAAMTQIYAVLSWSPSQYRILY
ncbi:hydrolase [Ktedonobacter sp. SOSP1-52]|uniref:glycoside hydrolase family 76 protein n=1 Tax=Ktedonobacter sp. SOSP1-52 TaxID=2778366 RepID=UPI0019161F0E|nr:glycoside hydrolase family 76 protein [Ktedonobacter sp. SOSP1-52]GHO67929.1 hydrolase [Ktedonobacter sp. SOSP1-52]